MARHSRRLFVCRPLHFCLLMLGMLFPNPCIAADCTLSFASPQSYAAGSAPSWVASGDFNGDSKKDLAVANNSSSDVSILLGNGDGTFQAAVNYGVGNGPSSVAVGDFNGDGNLDLVTANINSSDVSILLGNGDGTFAAAAGYAAGNMAYFVVTGDLNAN